MAKQVASDGSQHATTAEVEAAVGRLSEADFIRLDRFAKLRVRGLRALGLGLDADDLIQVALLKTLEGTRKWKRSVSFVQHLIGVIRSEASHAPDELKGHRPVESPRNFQDLNEPCATLASTSATPEQAASARETLTTVADPFVNDHEASLLIEALGEEMTGPEIREAFGWSQNNLETVTRRLRRAVVRKERSKP